MDQSSQSATFSVPSGCVVETPVEVNENEYINNPKVPQMLGRSFSNASKPAPTIPAPYRDKEKEKPFISKAAGRERPPLPVPSEERGRPPPPLPSEEIEKPPASMERERPKMKNPPSIPESPPVTVDLEYIQASLNGLSERVGSLEQDFDGTLTRDDLSSVNEELKGILPRIDETVELTRKLQADMAAMQHEIKRLDKHMQELAKKVVNEPAPFVDKKLEDLDCEQARVHFNLASWQLISL